MAELAKAKANLNIKNWGGFTPLHLCCQNGHNQSCRELLLAGCDTDVQNNVSYLRVFIYIIIDIDLKLILN